MAGTIKKFDPSPENPNKPDSKSRSFERISNNHLDNKNQSNLSYKSHSKSDNSRVSRVDKMLEKFSKEEKNTLTVPTPQVRYRSPSPSLLRKTQAVIAKEKCNEQYTAKNIPKSPVASHKLTSVFNKSTKIPCPSSPVVNKREKPKNESFQKAVAFWNLT